MKLSRTSRAIAAFATLFCLLFSQLAVAAYACPGLAPAQAAIMAGGMSGCPDMDMKMDKEQPGLCKAHCEAGQQTLDTAGLAQVPPFMPAALSAVLGERIATMPQVAAQDADRLSRSTAPPLSIRNCCFRI